MKNKNPITYKYIKKERKLKNGTWINLMKIKINKIIRNIQIWIENFQIGSNKFDLKRLLYLSLLFKNFQILNILILNFCLIK